MRNGDAIEGEFLKQLLIDYADQLKATYDDYYSDEHLISLMDCNEYTFTENGKRFG